MGYAYFGDDLRSADLKQLILLLLMATVLSGTVDAGPFGFSVPSPITALTKVNPTDLIRPGQEVNVVPPNPDTWFDYYTVRTTPEVGLYQVRAGKTYQGGDRNRLLGLFEQKKAELVASLGEPWESGTKISYPDLRESYYVQWTWVKSEQLRNDRSGQAVFTFWDFGQTIVIQLVYDLATTKSAERELSDIELAATSQ